jgi:hypothetical protein
VQEPIPDVKVEIKEELKEEPRPIFSLSTSGSGTTIKKEE